MTNAHLDVQSHKDSAEDASNFIPLLNYREENIKSQININNRITIKCKREKLRSILKEIIFCGMHDIAFKGKEADSENFVALHAFRSVAGEKNLL